MAEIAWGAIEADDSLLKTEIGPRAFEEFVGAEHARLFRAVYLVMGSGQEIALRPGS